MKVLVVVSGNHERVAPFVVEQAEALWQAGCDVHLFKVVGHGVVGYMRNLSLLKEQIREIRPDVIHAHYGLCGLLCTLQRTVPVVVTYHGSDINDPKMLRLSRITIRRASHNIFVSKRLQEKALANHPNHNSSVIPCGIDLSAIQPIGKEEARQKMGLTKDKHYILFTGAFDNKVKNAALAKEVIAGLNDEAVELLELKGYTREEVTCLMCASDVLLMTSLSEGSPQVIKEAMAAGLPIVSVDVGDVKELIGDTDSGIVVDRTPEALIQAIKPLLDHPRRSNGRQTIIDKQLQNTAIAQRLLSIYEQIK